jgi:rRNA maturation endonuclease Nob1
MLNVRNCRRCGKIFNYISGAMLCQRCRQLEEEDFKRIKEYLYQNPGSSLSQVSTELDISVERIKRFLKEGRLEIVGNDENFILECESCGRSIKTGRFCNDCATNLAGKFKNAAREIGKSIDEQDIPKRSSSLKYLYKDERYK